MRHDGIDHAHSMRVFSRIFTPKKKDFPGKFLTNLSGQICRTKSAIETRHIGVGLLEPCVFLACQCEIGNDMKTMTAAGRPSRNRAYDNLWHESDQALHLENVQASGSSGVDAFSGLALRILVAVATANSLITATAKCPHAVLWRWPISSQDDAADIGLLACMIECTE